MFFHVLEQLTLIFKPIGQALGIGPASLKHCGNELSDQTETVEAEVK